uniref:RNA-directed DNA polymerase n=1 Tax=Fagus sylvatica TaxID=28930 RepID=A0A2N9EZU9_FAGSY
MPPKLQQRRSQREVSVHTEHSHAESAANIQGQDQPQPPPSDPNREVPPTNLMLELIQSLQQNQSELAEAIKQLKEKYVDVTNLLKQEREKNPKEPRLFVKKPPYPIELLNLEKYIVSTFSRFDGQKGSALVHISKFINSMGAYAGNGDLCLREFSKSLDDRAYTWYTTLRPGSVKVWEDMVELFCGKYFQAEEKITLVNLHTTKQAGGEDLFRYIHCFHNISLDCYANYEEGELVGVCIDNMLPEFRAHLENLDISRFAQLLQKARKTALLVKPHTKKLKEKKSQPQVLTVSTVNNKRKKSNERSFEEPPPPVPFTLKEMMAILNKWVADGVVKLPEVSKKATEEDKKNPKFCYFHQYVHHSTADCWTLRRKFHEKIQDGTLELPQAKQKVHIDPFLKHKDRAVVSVVIHGSASDADIGRAYEDMEVQYPDHRRPLYLSATINEVQVRRALVDTGSCINLIPLSTIQAAEISQKKIQGAPMEIKGFGGVGEYTKGHIQLVLKPIRIAANPTPFDQFESHFVETALYDEVTPAGEASLAKPIGILLPKWEEIKDASKADLRDLLEQKKKRRAEASAREANYPQQEALEPEEGILQPSCLTVNETDVLESADTVGAVVADPKIFAKEELKTRNLLSHSLNVEPGTRPVVQPMRTFHPEVEAQITQEVKKLLSAGFIKPIQHLRWLSNIVPVKKKNGQIRCCVDFRNLNKACPKDEFPLPNKDLLIDSAAGHAMFSFMDGFSGYNQIFMSPRDAGEDCIPHSYWEFLLHRHAIRTQECWSHLKMNPLKCAFGVSVGKFLGFLVHQRGIDVDPARAFAIATMKPPTTYKELKSFLGQAVIYKKIYSWPCCCNFCFCPTLKERSSVSIGLPNAKKPLKSQAIGALIAQEDDNGVEQPICYVSRTLKDAESRYSGAERSCLVLIYASQRLRHYFLAHKVQLMTKSHPIRSLLQRPVLSGRLAQWLLQLSQYEIITEIPTAIKSQAIADLLAQFPGEDNSSISDEVPGEINEVFLAGLADSVWTLKFDGSSTTTSAGAGIVLYKDDGEAVTKSFKFDFPCFNNAAEYKAYLAGLAIVYEMGIKHLRVIGDSNLVIKKTGEYQSKPSSCFLTVMADLREIKDYTLISGDLYRRLPGGVLARCISLEEAKEKLPEVHEKTCGDKGAVSLYRRLQQLGYFWPNMSAEAAEIQSQCPTCQFHYSNEERLSLRYFVEGGTLFRKGFHGEPLRCLSPSESQMVMKETHTENVREHQGKKRLYQCLLTLDLIGHINPASGGYIWILVVTEYFTKWVEAIPLQKATSAAVANFIQEHIITRFGIPYKLITDNGTPFINKDVREVLEHYQVKYRRSTPYYPQGNGQAEATNRMLLRILSKMVFDYGNDWRAHLADVLWAYQSSPKTATGFTPFSLVYGTDTISPTELVVPSPRVMQGSELEVDANMCVEARMADLEGLDEVRDLAKARSQRNYQKMANVYSKALRVRIFTEGQMVFKAAEFVRRNLPSPSKFSPNWDGPYIIREAHGSGYYRLSKSDGTTLADPINGKWLKHYYS